EAVSGVASSLERARQDVDAREGEVLATIIDESRPKLIAAITTAEGRAERHARRSDIDSILKDARRAREKDRHEKARDLYHDALDIDSRNIEAVTGLGWALLSMGRTESASVQFRRAISINSSYEDAYIGLGRAERAKGNLHEALKVYEGYLSRFPTGKKASIARYQRDQIRKALGM
ncbi:MAG: tetratricopeptide repeat protein, partial [Myxococcota bacterium]|nr:tetratricopeptide repeat protein [Myxococcota bacterium]